MKNKNKSNEIKKLQGNFDRNHLKYETNKYIYDFQQPQTIISFDDFNGKFTISKADKKTSNLLQSILELNTKVDQDQNQVRSKMVKNELLILFKMEYFQ